MHLRGPMNVSQLAVYQLPGDSQALQKRNTVPFYNRRRAINKRGARFTSPGDMVNLHQTQFLDSQALNSTTSCSPKTVTSTITVIGCGAARSTSIPPRPQNTTYIGPLPCLPTPTPSSSTLDETVQDCAYNESIQTAAISQKQPVNTTTPSLVKPIPTSAQESVVRRAAPDWSRIAYYTSTAPAQATGLAFLANLGDPARSGTFD